MTTQVQVVNGNIDFAIRLFKKLIGKDGIHSQIKRRLAHVKPSEKREAKKREAAKRRIDAAKRKARDLNRRNNGYDEIRKQDQANRLFTIRHTIETDPTGRNQEDGKVS
jgi:ribosomal protein S21